MTTEPSDTVVDESSDGFTRTNDGMVMFEFSVIGATMVVGVGNTGVAVAGVEETVASSVELTAATRLVTVIVFVVSLLAVSFATKIKILVPMDKVPVGEKLPGLGIFTPLMVSFASGSTSVTVPLRTMELLLVVKPSDGEVIVKVGAVRSTVKE